MSSWAPNTWHTPYFRGKAVYSNLTTFEDKVKEQDKQHNKNVSRLRLRIKLEKEILDEQLKCHLFELEQRRELDRITLQKRKEEYHQEEEHKRLLGKQSFKEYTDKMKKLKFKNSWETFEDEDSKLINLEEEEEDRDEMRKFSGGSGMWE